jgi:hypothetical protein
MTVNFKEGLKTLQEKEAVKRHPEPPARVEKPGRSPSRQGKVPLTQWVDPAVRKQVQQIGLDHDKDQYELVDEALNLMFEKYGKPPIA